jgi:hypothetical protein
MTMQVQRTPDDDAQMLRGRAIHLQDVPLQYALTSKTKHRLRRNKQHFDRQTLRRTYKTVAHTSEEG